VCSRRQGPKRQELESCQSFYGKGEHFALLLEINSIAVEDREQALGINSGESEIIWVLNLSI